MGQYYRPTFLNEDKSEVIATTEPLTTWFDGMKLMEHSYYGTDVVRATMEMLKNELNGFRFVWAGDYADNTIGDKNVYDVADANGTDFADKLDTETRILSGKRYHRLPEKYGQAKYLLNYDKRAAVLLTPDGDNPIHPLPLLTAESNGLGGGDYRGPEMSLVGSWKYDHIGASDELPEGFSVDEIVFEED